MPAAFSINRDRLNRAAVARLSDAEATWNGSSVQGAFDRHYIDPLGVASANPVFRALQSDLPGVAEGDLIYVAGGDYSVATVEPDGGGMVLLQLEAA